MKLNALLIGLVAGCASALLLAGIVTGSTGALGLAFLAPLPVMLASLGWGSASGFVAAGAVFVALAALSGSPLVGLSAVLSAALPGAILGHIAGLARPSGNGLDWFPVPRILFAIAVLAVLLCLILGVMSGFDADELAPVVAQALQAQGSPGLSADQLREVAQFLVWAIPFVQPAFLVLTLVACLYLAAAITRISGRLQRPRDDIPSSTGLPRLSLPIFVLSIALCFLEGSIAAVAAVVAGAFACAFVLVGLAATHRQTRGRAARGLLLFTVYAGILLLSFPLLAFLVLGVFETSKQPATPSAPPPKP